MNGWMARACFFLLAIVVLAQVAVTMAGGATCFYLFLRETAQVGDCSGFTGQAREMWAEVLAAILALMLAARGDPPKPPSPDERKEP